MHDKISFLSPMLPINTTLKVHKISIEMCTANQSGYVLYRVKMAIICDIRCDFLMFIDVFVLL